MLYRKTTHFVPVSDVPQAAASNQRLPPLNALRAYEVAARHLSFALAARELHVTPAAISHQIKGLEDFLDHRLFRRLKRGLELTRAGQVRNG